MMVGGDDAIFGVVLDISTKVAKEPIELFQRCPTRARRRTHMRFRPMALVLVILLGSGITALAQETTGTIKGRIADAQGLAVPGATVTVSGTQGTKTTVTDGEGRFNIPFLTPGAYNVRAELQGFKAVEQKDVAVGLGRTVEIPLRMEIGGLTETVQVTATTPIVDSTTTTSGAVLDTRHMQRVPVGRRVSDTLYLAPGVSSSGSAGTANPSISGGSGLDNQYVIDGVNVTNQGYGALGSYSIVFGSLGNATPFDFIKEVQVKTGGYEAEFGQSTGGVVNVVTKSGINDLRGSVFGYARPTGSEGNLDAVPVAPTAACRPTRHAASTTPASRAAVRSSRTGCSSSARSIRSGTRRRCTRRPGLPTRKPRRRRPHRGTTSPIRRRARGSSSGRHRIDASFFGDPSTGDNGPQRGLRAARRPTRLVVQLARTTAATTRPSATTACLSSSWLRRGRITPAR